MGSWTKNDGWRSEPVRERGGIRWGVTFALTVAMVAVLVVLGSAAWLSGRSIFQPDSVRERSVTQPGQWFRCPLRSDERMVALEKLVSEHAPGLDGFHFWLVDAWGQHEVVVVADDQVHFFDLTAARQRVLPSALVSDPSDPVFESAPLEPALTELIGVRMTEAAMHARSIKDDRSDDVVFDGFGLRIRVEGWLCADAFTPPADSDAGRLHMIMNALSSHARLTDPDDLASSTQLLRELAGKGPMNR